ncbi:MAG: glycosyltransferase family 2 protein [Bacteroidota bacterium]
MKACAIVLLNYNGAKVLPQFLPSVLAHSSFDIWVIDNASTDTSLYYLRQEFPSVSLICLSENYGFAAGYNLGLEKLKGDYETFILLNTDVEVSPSWDQELVAHLQANSACAAVQPKILSWKEKEYFDYAGAGGGFLDAFGYPYCRGRIWNTLEKDQGQYDDTISVDWASGACMAIRSQDFFEQHGFDPHFFAHMEEIDLCWRLRGSGKNIAYLGQVRVYHLGGATLDRASPQKLYLNIRNSLAMIYKQVSFLRFLFILLIKGGIEGVALLTYLITGKFTYAKAIGRGYADFFVSQKSKSLKTKHPSGKIGSGPALLVFAEHKLLGKKKFSDL